MRIPPQSLAHDDLNPSAVHGRPRELVRIVGPRRSVTFSGAPAGIATRRPPFDCCDRARAAGRPDQSQKALPDIPGGAPGSNKAYPAAGTSDGLSSN